MLKNQNLNSVIKFFFYIAAFDLNKNIKSCPKFLDNKKSISLCEIETPDQCLVKQNTVDNFFESIQIKFINEITSFYKWASDSNEQKENFIQCSDKNLVIDVVSAAVSNVDKTKCLTNPLLTKNADCTEKTLTSVLASKM